MIELFSWLTDQMLYRFNQVPLRNYIVFLEMLGIRLNPPAAARTLITFELTKAQNTPFPIPAGTEVSTERTETEEAIIFSTDRELLIGIPRIKCFLKAQEYYRTGGGTQGNVEAETLTVLRSAIPYVKQVINYQAATGGTEPESLEKAVLRVPGLLRSSQRAITQNDFEYHAMRVPDVNIARAHCLDANMEMGQRSTDPDAIKPGQVCILAIPKVETQNLSLGLSPQELKIDQVKTKIIDYLDERKPLGVQILVREPKYIGVKVEAFILVGANADRSRITCGRLRISLIL